MSAPISVAVHRVLRNIEQRRAARDSLAPKIKAHVPDPDHDAVHGLAAEMARSVARGWMHPSHAYAALVLAAHKLPDGDALFPAVWRTLCNHVAWHIRTREETAMRIGIALQPLMAVGKPRNALLAAAHGVNGNAGFPLDEEEVRPVVVSAVWRFIQPAPRRRHVQ